MHHIQRDSEDTITDKTPVLGYNEVDTREEPAQHAQDFNMLL